MLLFICITAVLTEDKKKSMKEEITDISPDEVYNFSNMSITCAIIFLVFVMYYFKPRNEGNKGDATATSTTDTIEEVFPLTEPNDINFANIAEGSSVSGTTLPSGLIVPAKRDGREWKIRTGKIVLEKAN
jgi:hypothetical protein